MNKKVPWIVLVMSFIMGNYALARADQAAAKAMYSGLNKIMGQGYHAPLTLPDNWQDLLLKVGLPVIGGIILLFIAVKVIKSMGEEKPKPMATYKSTSTVVKNTVADKDAVSPEVKKDAESDDPLTKEAEELVQEFFRQNSEKK